ncbi:MAG: SGNH/GDSL hydrolase family protein, partial [Anaerolineales bacterium]|nr:SGNH/GDSL hydrolase family protein [Anaerolineales bacterium]
IQFSNLGIGAQTSAQVLLRYEAHVAPLEPDIIVLQVGINDLKTIPLFPERREELVTDCQDNIAAIVTKARADGALVILSTVFPAGDVPLQRRPFWSAGIDAAIVEVNAFLQTLADDHILVFDSYSLLADDEGSLSSDYARDELHLNSAGYERLNEALAQLLGTVVESTDVE